MRAAGDALAHAAAEQPVEEARLPRPDHDQVGARLVRGRDELVGRVAERRPVLGLDRTSRQCRPRPLETRLSGLAPLRDQRRLDNERW